MLIAYAGKTKRADWTLERHCSQRFRHGKDTAEIAEATGISEAEALQIITIERSRRLGLPSPYCLKGQAA